MKNLKKIFTISIYFILAGITLVSCHSGKSFSQRHYKNRDYTGIGKSDRPESTLKNETNETAKVDQKQTPETFIVAPVVEEINNSETIGTEDPAIAKSENNDLAAVEEFNENRSPFNYRANNIDKIQENFFAPIKHTIDERKKSAYASSEGQALSLLWIVILVLIILWALGILVGGVNIGGLINILLVIALILLILWLLRII